MNMQTTSSSSSGGATAPSSTGAGAGTEYESLLEGDRFKARIATPDGLLFVGGLSNSYEATYPRYIHIGSVIGEAELRRLVVQFNDAVQGYWPCTACYAFGCLAAPFTLGLSLCIPNYCISEAEIAGASVVRSGRVFITPTMVYAMLVCVRPPPSPHSSSSSSTTFLSRPN